MRVSEKSFFHGKHNTVQMLHMCWAGRWQTQSKKRHTHEREGKRGWQPSLVSSAELRRLLGIPKQNAHNLLHKRLHDATIVEIE